MAIYENVKRACSEKGTNINQLEQTLGFSKGSICKWDKNTPSIEKVKAVADALNKPISFFVE